MGAGPAPHFMVVPSLACNARCSYCFGPRQGAVMTAAQAERTIDYVARIAAGTGQDEVGITFHGGEPLAAGHAVWRALLGRVSERFAAHRRRLDVQSNLWLLDEEFCRLFAAHGVQVGTSLDGPAELTDSQRGEGYFARTTRGIALARAHGLRCSAIATFTPEGLGQWRSVLAHFAEEELPLVVHPALPPLGAARGGPTLSPEQHGTLLVRVLAAAVRHRHASSIASATELIQAVAHGAPRVCTFRRCLGMFLAIDPTGWIHPCQRFCGQEAFRIGHVDEGRTLDELLQHPVAQRLRRREEEIQRVCADCEHLPYCNGGCAYNAWAAGGEAALRDPYCPAYRRAFSAVARRLRREMAQPRNLEAMADAPWSGEGHPLLRAGRTIALADRKAHPSARALAARRIVVAGLLGRMETPAAADAALARGLFASAADAERFVRQVRGELDAGPRLNNLYLHVTYRCPLRCDHCYVYARPDADRAEEASVDAARRWLSQARDAGFRQAIVCGGEPLHHRDRQGLLAALRDVRPALAPMRIVVRTSLALALSDAELAELAEGVDQIVVSVDGDERTHDARRGRGAHGRTVENLRRLRARTRSSLTAAELSLACVLTAPEIRGPAGRAVKALADELGIRRVRFRPLLPLGRARGMELSPETLCEHLTPERQLEAGFEPCRTCGLGHNLYVAPDGEAFPCHACREHPVRLGSLHTQTVGELLGAAPFQALRRHDVDTNARCHACDVRYLCGGACRAWDRDGTRARDLDAGPAECGPLRRRAEGLLGAAEAWLARS